MKKVLKLLGVGVLLFAGLIIALVFVAVLRSPASATAQQDAPPPLPRLTAPAAPPAPVASPATEPAAADGSTFPGDGTFLVGADVQPGTYRTKGGSPCYWARLSDVSGSFDSILANSVAQGPAIVEIKKTDKAFQSRGCAAWQTVAGSTATTAKRASAR